MARADELAADEEIRRNDRIGNRIKNTVGTGLGIAGAAVTGGIASRLAPLLSGYVPVNLAVKGINAISPKLGQMLKRGQSMGLDLEEGLDFIRRKFGPKPQNPAGGAGINAESPEEQPQGDESQPQDQQNTQERPRSFNTLVGYSPQLHDMLVDEISNNAKDPLNAAIKAIHGSKGLYDKVIKQIEKDYGEPFHEIVRRLYGSYKQKKESNPNPPSVGQPQQPTSQPDMRTVTSRPVSRQQPAAQTQQPQPISGAQPQQQGSAAKNAVMAAIQEMAKRRGG